MTDFDDDVDFQRLTNEVTKSLAKDEKYQRENDAKFRAIHQKVRNYDEFRDIVEASHLRPLDKDDKIGGVSYQKWNQLANGNKQTSASESDQQPPSQSSFAPPNNPYEFSHTWKRRCVTSEDKCNYLLSISPEVLRKCLESDCMLGDIVSALDACIEEHSKQLQEIFVIFDLISTTSRFSLSLDFLNTVETNKLKSIFQALKPCCTENDGQFKKLCDAYKLIV